MGGGLLADEGLALGTLEEDLADDVDVGAVGGGDVDEDALLLVRSGGLVDDAGVADDLVGDVDLDVVAGEDPGGAQADLGDPAAQAVLEHDEVAELVGGVGDDEDAGEEVGERVLGGEADGDADDAGGGEPAGEVERPGDHDQVDRGAGQEDLGQHGEQREGARLEHAGGFGAVADVGEDGGDDADQGAGPQEDGDADEAGGDDEVEPGAGAEQVDGDVDAEEQDAQEDRSPQVGDDDVVEVGLRVLDEDLQDAAEQDLDQEGDHEREGQDDERLQGRVGGQRIEAFDEHGFAGSLRMRPGRTGDKGLVRGRRGPGGCRPRSPGWRLGACRPARS